MALQKPPSFPDSSASSKKRPLKPRASGPQPRSASEAALQTADLAPSNEPPRVKLDRNPGVSEDEKPSSKLAKRQADANDRRTLGESLAMANAAVPPGEGKAGKAVKAAFGGAAAGASLGEAIADMMAEKSQAGREKEGRTASERAMQGKLRVKGDTNNDGRMTEADVRRSMKRNDYKGGQRKPSSANKKGEKKKYESPLQKESRKGS